MSAPRAGWGPALLALAVVMSPARARADFEAELVRRVMAERGLVALDDPATAEERIITRIEVAAVPVFTPADPVPDSLNALHVTTREHVIRQELLFGQGDAYDAQVVEETARNLRGMAVLTTAAVVPFAVGDPRGVGVLVVTKDIWSLRHGFVDLFFDPARFSDTLRVRGALTETNLLGLNKSVALRYARDPWTREIGQSFLDRRVLGSRWLFLETVDALFDEETGATARGSYQLVRPFYSLDTQLAGQLVFEHDAGTSRALAGAEVSEVVLPARPGAPALSAPRQFDRDTWNGGATVAWQSLGSLKHRLGLSLTTAKRDLTPVEGVPAERREDFFDAIRRRSEFSNVLQLSWALIPTDYHTLRDADVYGVTEDFLAGPQLSASAGLSTSALGSDADFARVAATAGWRVVGRRQLVLGAFLRGGARRQGGGFIDRFVGLDLSMYSPRTAAGRVVWKTSGTLRAANRNQGVVALGGDAGLRGYPLGAVRGDSAWTSNLEWRGRPLYWMTYQLGAVAFVDSGAAWFEGATPAPLHAVGVGLRWLMPQFNHRLMRLDLAAPADALERARLVFSFDQAF